MQLARFSTIDFHRKFIPLIGSLFLIAGCSQSAVSPELRLGLIVLTAIVSFVIIFTKPIFGVYAALVVSTSFSPTVRLGFANLYFHQWIILIALLASIASGLISQNFHVKAKSEITMPMMVFIGSLLLSVTHAPNMMIGVKSFLYIGVFIASYYLVLLCVNREEHIRRFMSLLIVATSVVCIISLKDFGSERLGSLVLRNPNSFGNFLALVIPFCTSLLFFGGLRRGKRLVLGLSIILMSFNLILTFSRSAWVGVFVGILCLIVLKPRASLLLLLCGVIGAVLFVNPIHKRIVEDISDPGAQYRITKAKIAYEKFKEHPILGNGLGSFHYEAQFSDVWAYRAHSTLENNYLLMLAEGGIIEFLAFLYLMIALGRRAIFLLNRIKDPFLYPILLGSIASIISTLAAGMFEDTLFFPKNNWLIGMFMGLIIVIGKMYEGSVTASDPVEGEADAESMNSQMERG
jgi:O-antigen ligase